VLLGTTCTSVSLLKMGNVCPKHVELILEINKTVIVASSWSSIFTLPNCSILWNITGRTDSLLDVPHPILYKYIQRNFQKFLRL
jgi:hypothetical protein